MVLCNICGAKNKNDALHCAQCGARLETKQCRQCGTILAKNERFCNKCGYPSSGKPCPQCGKVVPDEASFCATCGYSFEEEKTTGKRTATAKSAGGTATKSAAASKGGTKAKSTAASKGGTTAKSAAASKSGTAAKSATASKSGTAARKRTATPKTDAAKAESASTVVEEETTTVAAQEKTPAKKPTARKKPAPKPIAAEEKPAEEPKPIAAEEKPAEEPKPIAAEEKPAEEPKPIAAEEKPAEEPKPIAAEEKPAEEPKPIAAEEKPAEEPKPIAAEEKPAEEPKPIAAEEKTAKEPKPTYSLLRAFAMPVMLLAMLITSFFGMFKAEIPFLDGEFAVTGFEAVRGITCLINAPTDEELQIEFAEFIQDGAYEATEKGLKDAIRDFGVLRMAITEESITPDLVLQVTVWGVTSLAIMVTAFVLFLLSLIHAIQVARKKKTGAYKHETLPFALITALAFSFLMTGGAPASGAIALWILGAVTLAGITTCKYKIDKQPRPSLAVNVRRGVCGVLVILAAIFATSGLVTVSYKDSSVQTEISAEELYEGMTNVLEDAENIIDSLLPEDANAVIRATDLDAVIREILASDQIEEEDKQMLLRCVLSPVVLCYSEEAIDAFDTSVQAASWLLFAANLLFAAMTVLALFRILQNCANPADADKNALFTGLAALGAAAVFGTSVPFMVMGNSIAADLSLGVKFGLSGLLIAGLVLGIVAFVADAVGYALAKKKDTKELTAPPAEQKSEG